MMDSGPIRRKIVIDTDAGLDDAQAILMALASDNVDVVAIKQQCWETLQHLKLQIMCCEY